MRDPGNEVAFEGHKIVKTRNFTNGVSAFAFRAS